MNRWVLLFLCLFVSNLATLITARCLGQDCLPAIIGWTVSLGVATISWGDSE